MESMEEKNFSNSSDEEGVSESLNEVGITKKWPVSFTTNRARARDELGQPLPLQSSEEIKKEKKDNFINDISFSSPLKESDGDTTLVELRNSLDVHKNSSKRHTSKYGTFMGITSTLFEVLSDNRKTIMSDEEYISHTSFNSRHSYALSIDSMTELDTVKEKLKQNKCVRFNDEFSFVEENKEIEDDIPREDMTRIQSAFIGNSPPNSIPTLVRSISLTENRTPETKISKLKKLFTMGRSEENETPKQASNSKFYLMELNGKPNFGEMNLSIEHSGMLVQCKGWIQVNVKLSDGFLKWSSEKGENSISLMHVTSITLIKKLSGCSLYTWPLHVFEVGTCAEEGVARSVELAARNDAERATWLQKILMATTSAFPPSLTQGFTRAGWLNVKEGVGGSWVSCWMMLRDRELFYWVQPPTFLTADLRKARCIVPQQSGGLQEDSVTVLVDLNGRSLYLQALSERDTNRWGLCIRTAALNNGDKLEQQQLTKNNVPVIVEKCINFVAAYGSNSEGLYRRMAGSPAVSKLLTELRKDAWSAQISSDISVHVVASVLRIFFAELAEPLLAGHHAVAFCQVAMSKCHHRAKIERYRSLWRELPRVNHVTSRRLFGHLHFLQRCNNDLDPSSVASAWSTSLVQQRTGELLEAKSSRLLYELISYYPDIYDVTDEEIAREMKILQVVQELREPPPACVEPASVQNEGLRVWVHIGAYQAGQAQQIWLVPHTTAGEVCSELGRGEDHMLQEFVLGGALARPLHASERVLQVVMRWGDWDEADRKDNQLVLATCLFYAKLQSKARVGMTASGQLTFADAATKIFKNGHFELGRDSLRCYRDEKSSTKLGEWNIHELIWYLGHEPEREPNTKWAITFISRTNKEKRSRELPYFGVTIAGQTKRELVQWSTALLVTSFPGGL